MSKLENVKNHFKNNKRTYITAGTVVIVAGVAYYIGSKNASAAAIKAAELTKGEVASASTEFFGDVVVNNAARMKQVACYKPVMNNIIEFAERSCLSKAIVRLGEDGGIEAAWASINEAARNTDWSAAAISKCANGLTENLGGEKYAFLKDLIDVAS